MGIVGNAGKLKVNPSIPSHLIYHGGIHVLGHGVHQVPLNHPAVARQRDLELHQPLLIGAQLTQAQPTHRLLQHRRIRLGRDRVLGEGMGSLIGHENGQEAC